MIKKKSVLFIIVFVILLSFIAIYYWVMWHSQGSCFVWKFVHLDREETCYLYDAEEKKILGQAVVSMKGNGNAFSGMFKGKVVIEGYEMEDATSVSYDFTTYEQFGVLYVTGNKFILEKDSTEEDIAWIDFTKYSYMIIIDKNNPERFLAKIVPYGDERKKSEEHVICAVHAATEKEAEEIYLSMQSEFREALSADSEK